MKNLKIIGMLIGTALLATACGGGGSGGGSSSVSKPIAPAERPITGTADEAYKDQGISVSSQARNLLNPLVGSGAAGSSAEAFEAAHNDGWTGKGFTVLLHDDAESALAESLAPGAEIGYSDDGESFEVFNSDRSDDRLVFTSPEGADKGTVVASGASLIWHKFDSLSATELGGIIASTRNTDGSFNLEQALSPVGNLK